MENLQRVYTQQDRLMLEQSLENIQNTRIRIVQKDSQGGERNSSEETLPLLQALQIQQTQL